MWPFRVKHQPDLPTTCRGKLVEFQGTQIALDLYPKKSVLVGSHAEQQFVAIARYDDGSTRDVTKRCVFLSNNDSSVAVTEAGLARSDARGEAFVMARFATITERSQVIVLPADSEAISPDRYPANNEIDRLVNAKLATLRMAPSDLCSDEEFLRRVYIDLVGIMPSTQEYRDFTGRPDDGNRAALIDELLERDEFVDLWATVFCFQIISLGRFRPFKLVISTRRDCRGEVHVFWLQRCQWFAILN